MLIQATLPEEQRWKRWVKEDAGRVYIMDIWTEREIGALLCVHRISSLTTSHNMQQNKTT
jgi:hypothetical protein